MQNQHLYHYGVKGMRWGVRRTPEERLKRYTSREIEKVESRRLRENRYENRRIKKNQNKYDRLKGNSKDSRKIETVANNLIAVKANSYANSAIAKQEIERLSSMKYEDMTAEKKAVGKSIIKSSLIVSTSMADIIKTNYRVDASTQAKIFDVSYKKANEEVLER